MPYAWQYVKPGEGSLIPNRADPLWRHCRFAAAPGSIKGQRQLATPLGDLDDGRSASRATIFTAGGFTPNGVNWQRWSGGGRGFDNGDGVTSLNPEGWDGTAQDFYAIPQAGFTAAVIIRPDGLSTNGQLPFFKRGAQPYGAANAGWRFTGAAGNVWRFNYSDGATQRTVTGGAQDANFTRPDLLVARLNVANTQLDWFVNGAQIAVAGFAATPVGNPAATEDIKILGYGPLNEVYPGFITFAAMWAYPLPDSLIQRLYADPFIMWRRQAGPLGDFGGAGHRGLIDFPGAMRIAPPSPVLNNVLGPGGAAGGCCCCPAAAIFAH